MKKRALLDSIEVKTPCTQDWNRMYGNDEVRFCEHCVKHVHDLSAMTRREAQEFAATAKGSVCIRYVRRPDGKIQTAGDKLHQISGRASRLAASVFGASLTLASSAYAQESMLVELPTRGAVIKVDKQTKDTPKQQTGDGIYGTVTDPNGAVVTGARVILTDEKSGAEQTTLSDDAGGYFFSDVKAGQYKLRFESPGFVSYEIQNIDFNDQIDTKYDVTLNIAMAMMGDMAIGVSYENQLVLAVQDNDIERIKQLIGQNVNVNEKDGNGGITALHLAVQEGKTKIVEILLNAGARVNIRDESRRTAMMMIAEDFYGDDDDESETRPAPEIFRLLISHGAKVNLRDSEGMTALMYAARNHAAELVRLLIIHRADVNIQSKNGRTALMEALDESEPKTIRILLEAGADVNLKDDDGETVLSLCSDDDVRQLLISYGAQQPEEPPEEPRDN